MNLTEYVRFVVTLLAVVDPFLAVPFFLAFTRRIPLDNVAARRQIDAHPGNELQSDSAASSSRDDVISAARKLGAALSCCFRSFELALAQLLRPSS